MAPTASPPLPASVTTRTVPALLAAAVERAPDRRALVSESLLTGEETTLTYAELADRSARLATVLRERGIGRGDRVAIMIGNDGGIEAHVTYHAVHRLGAINVPVNTFYVGRELTYAFSFIEPAAVVFARRFAPLIRELDTGDAVLLEVDPAPELGEPYGALLDATTERAEQVALDEHEECDWLFTSGTSGHPKAVAFTHANAVACGIEAVPLWELDADSVYQNSAPFFTSTGCHTNLLPCLVAQCTYVIDPEVDAQAIVERARRNGTTSMFILTAVLAILFRRVDDGRLTELDFGDLKRIAYGGQTMPKAFHERIQRELGDERGIGLGGVYGLTEGGTSGLMLDPADHRDAVARMGSYGMSIGRRTWTDWIDFRLVREDGIDAAPGEVGEIWLRAPSVMQRYVGSEEDTAAALAGGWLHTGDMALRDNAGFVFFVDRSKSMIRRGGMNISAAEIEGVALGHPAVAEAVAIGRPNPVLGEDVHLVLVLHAAPAVTEEELIAYCAEHLAEYKVPRATTVVDALPKNGMNRVMRGELADLLSS